MYTLSRHVANAMHYAATNMFNPTLLRPAAFLSYPQYQVLRRYFPMSQLQATHGMVIFEAMRVHQFRGYCMFYMVTQASPMRG